MAVASLVTCVKVRRSSDLSWKLGNDGILYVRPHPSLSEEEQRGITEEIDNHYSPGVQIYVDDGEGWRNVRNLVRVQTKTICVLIYSKHDISKIAINGAGNTRAVLLPEFVIDDEFREQMRISVPTFGILFMPELSKKWYELAERWFMRIIQVGCGFLITKALVKMSANVKSSGAPIMNIHNPSVSVPVSVPNINVLNFSVEKWDLKGFFGRNILREGSGD